MGHNHGDNILPITLNIKLCFLNDYRWFITQPFLVALETWQTCVFWESGFGERPEGSMPVAI